MGIADEIFGKPKGLGSQYCAVIDMNNVQNPELLAVVDNIRKARRIATEESSPETKIVIFRESESKIGWT